MNDPCSTAIAEGYRLRSLRISDAEAFHRIVSDPAVRAPTSYDIADIAAARAVVERWIAGESDGTARRWAIAGVDDDQLVGTCGFHRFDPRHLDAELGYEVAPTHWGRGVASVSVRAVVRWALGAGGIRRVHAYVWEGNLGSIHVLERTGFRREGRLREFRLCRGEPRDFLLYAVLRGDVPDVG